MVEVIVLTREQYLADIKEAARLGAIEVMKSIIPGDEWISYEKAKELLSIKSDAAFRNWRSKNKFHGPDRVRLVGRNKQFNKKYL